MYALILSSADCGCDQRFQVPIHHVMGYNLGLKAEINPLYLTCFWLGYFTTAKETKLSLWLKV